MSRQQQQQQQQPSKGAPAGDPEGPPSSAAVGAVSMAPADLPAHEQSEALAPQQAAYPSALAGPMAVRRDGSLYLAKLPYEGISDKPFPQEAQQVLMAPVQPVEVEIRPDGIVYLPQVFYRRRLTRALGAGAWALKPEARPHIDQEAAKVYYHGSLWVFGRFVSEAIGEHQYRPNNPNSSYASAIEASKSDCLVRCCKDLSLGSEVWDPEWIHHWRKTFAIQVRVFNRYKNRDEWQWRRKDRPPLEGEYRQSPPSARPAPQAASKKDQPQPQEKQDQPGAPEPEEPVASASAATDSPARQQEPENPAPPAAPPQPEKKAPSKPKPQVPAPSEPMSTAMTRQKFYGVLAALGFRWENDDERHKVFHLFLPEYEDATKAPEADLVNLMQILKSCLDGTCDFRWSQDKNECLIYRTSDGEVLYPKAKRGLKLETREEKQDRHRD